MRSSSFFLRVFSVFAVVLNFQSAFGQSGQSDQSVKSEGVLSTRARVKPIRLGENGVYVEAAFTSLNSSGARISEINGTTEPFGIKASDGSNPAHLVGLGAGYRLIKTRALGFDVGGQLFQESNKLGGSHSIYYQVAGNLNYTFVPHFYGYVGPNVTVMELREAGRPGSATTIPEIGGQIGLGYAIRGFSMKLGFHHIQYKMEYDYWNQYEYRTVRYEGGLNGVVTQIGYVF